METRNIIVIGASAGGFEVIKQLVAGLPDNLNASIFIVWHMAPEVKGVLPQVLNKQRTLLAVHAQNRDPIIPGRIYVAPPDRHLILEKDSIRVTRGPKENGFRPAVDPLFRSAAYNFGSRVIGIVLSGALDDGTAGLWAIKQYGGVAIVQHPSEAEVDSMPMNAIREVSVDHIVSVAEMPQLLVRLTTEEVPAHKMIDAEVRKTTEREIRIALQDNQTEETIMQFGDLSPFSCPECHGVLSVIKEGQRTRYRCHTGHAFSADSLLAVVSENIEKSLWNSIRAMEESVILLNHMGDHFAEANEPHMAARYFQKAGEAFNRSKLVRKAVLNHEHLTADNIEENRNKTNRDQS